MMAGRNDPDDLSALANYIRRVSPQKCCGRVAEQKLLIECPITPPPSPPSSDVQLEISLARKDELLAAKDLRIDALEAVVASTRNDATRAEPIAAWRASGGAPENPDGDDCVDDGARTAARAPWGGDFAPRRTASSSRSTPDRVVSDDSGEAAAADDDGSSCLLLGLSRISLARSWDGDSRDADDDGDVEPADGRWNIPFDDDDDEGGDGGVEEESARVSPPGDGRGGGPAVTGFVPIGGGGGGRAPFPADHATPSRPLATRVVRGGAPPTTHISPPRPPATGRGRGGGGSGASPRPTKAATGRNLSGDLATNEKENVSPDRRVSVVFGALFDLR